MRERKRKRAEEGMTLIELVIVLVILAMLATLVGPQLYNKLKQSKPQVAKLQIAKFGEALNMFALEIGRYPTTSEGLEALVRNPGNQESWKGPYLDKSEVPKDPWGRNYVYRSPGEHGEYDLFSMGPDGIEGGDGENADIVSWK